MKFVPQVMMVGALLTAMTLPAMGQERARVRHRDGSCAGAGQVCPQGNQHRYRGGRETPAQQGDAKQGAAQDRQQNRQRGGGGR